MNHHPLTRRRLLHTGSLAGTAGLSQVMRLRAAAGESGGKRDDTAVILVWLTVGLSHMDTFDLKPDAPLEYRGEFGHTPRISSQPGTGTGIVQPGRDHWPAAMSILVSGGGLRMGQVVGSTNRPGEHPQDRPLSPGDLWATTCEVIR